MQQLGFEEVVNRYLEAYTSANLETLLALVSDDIEFESYRAGKREIHVVGKADFQAMMARAMTLFTSREQRIITSTPHEEGLNTELAFKGIFTPEYAEKQMIGRLLRLQNQTAFRIREGKLYRIVEMS